MQVDPVICLRGVPASGFLYRKVLPGKLQNPICLITLNQGERPATCMKDFTEKIPEKLLQMPRKALKSGRTRQI